MFKSIQWKLVIMFVLLIISVMIVVSIFLSEAVSKFYHNEFAGQMKTVFDRSLIKQLEDEISKQQDMEASAKKAFDIITTYIGPLGIDSNRNYYVLDGDSGSVQLHSGVLDNKKWENTGNIISALAGKPGNEIKSKSEFMDFAVPLKMQDGTVKHIVYIKDDKEELYSIQKNILDTILNAVLIGIIISVVFGFFLSRTITTPIAILTQKAEKIAEGDFESKIEVRSRDEIGKLTNTFNFMGSELKATLEQIDSEKNKMETILLYMTDGVIAFDLEGRIIHINPAARRMLEIDEEEYISFDDFFKSIHVDISLGELIYLEHWTTVERPLDINDQHLKAFFAAFKIEKEKTGGVVVVLQDITEQQKLDAARREFVANVSHELRTPLTSIKSYTETLLEGAMEDREIANQFLKVINNESDRMTRLVKDLLLLSRLDYTQNQWNKEEYSLVQLIDEVMEKLWIEAKNHSHELTFTKTTEIPLLYGDRDRIQQVIINIITNAIKYTPDGGKISVYAGRLYNEAYVKIIDNGMGIPKQDLPRIFERFYRVDKARSRELGGTGLGLAIAKEIILAHNGTITIDSDTGKGTEVIIKLPVYQERN